MGHQSSSSTVLPARAVFGMRFGLASFLGAESSLSTFAVTASRCRCSAGLL